MHVHMIKPGVMWKERQGEREAERERGMQREGERESEKEKHGAREREREMKREKEKMEESGAVSLNSSVSPANLTCSAPPFSSEREKDLSSVDAFFNLTTAAPSPL